MSTLKTGKVKTTTIADELDTESTAVTNVINGSAKAWVNFNGSSDVILSSFNVSSLTNVTTGRNTINFTTAFNDTNYCVVTGNNDYSGDSGLRVTGVDNSTSKTTSSVTISTKYNSSGAIGSPIDYSVQNGVVVFN